MAITLKRQQCSRAFKHVVNGMKLCGIHIKSVDTVKPATALPTSAEQLFLCASTRSNNASTNALRENCLLNYMNNPDADAPYLKGFRDCLETMVPKGIRYDTLRLVKKGGRRYNYDFDCEVVRNTFVQTTLKVEFKYGCSGLRQYPQFIALYCSKEGLFTRSYLSEWYNRHLKKFLAVMGYTGPKCNYADYLKIVNSTTYAHPLQKFIKTHSSAATDALVDRSITTFIHTLSRKDVCFSAWDDILAKQVEKIFIFCNKGIFTAVSLDKIKLDRTFMERKTYSIVLRDTTKRVHIELRLRWKNTKGCAGPAWQVKMI